MSSILDRIFGTRSETIDLRQQEEIEQMRHPWIPEDASPLHAEMNVVKACEVANQRHTGRNRGDNIHVWWYPGSDHHPASCGRWLEAHGAQVGVIAHRVSSYAELDDIYHDQPRGFASFRDGER